MGEIDFEAEARAWLDLDDAENEEWIERSVTLAAKLREADVRARAEGKAEGYRLGVEAVVMELDQRLGSQPFPRALALAIDARELLPLVLAESERLEQTGGPAMKPTIEELRDWLVELAEGGSALRANALLAALDVAEACVDWTADHVQRDCHTCGMPDDGTGVSVHDEECPVGAFEAATPSAGSTSGGRQKR